jgi:hypothetical protein
MGPNEAKQPTRSMSDSRRLNKTKCWICGGRGWGTPGCSLREHGHSIQVSQQPKAYRGSWAMKLATTSNDKSWPARPVTR